MRVSGIAIALVGSLLLPTASMAQVPDSTPAYSLAPIRYEVHDADPVGRRSAGLVCGPAGRLRWADVQPDRERAMAAIGDGLRAAGLDLFMPNDVELEDGVVRGRQRIYARFMALSLNACVSGWGPMKRLTGPGTWKGSGTILVEWRVYDAASRAQRASVETCTSFKGGKFNEPSRLVELALRTGAEEFARTRAMRPDGAAGAPSMPCGRETSDRPLAAR